MSEARGPLLVLTGATAVGKKEIGLAVARRIGAEVVGMDSIKVYRGLRIGAATTDDEPPGPARTHVVGVADPTRPFSVGRWIDAAREAVAEIDARQNRTLFLGGTPLYLRALLQGFFQGPPADAAIRARLEAEAASDGIDALQERLRGIDPDAAARIFRGDLKRISRALEVYELTGRPITALQREGTVRPFDRELRVVGVRVPPDLHRIRIAARVERMLSRGLVDEVRRLLAEDALRGEAAAAIGYRETAAHLRGELTLEELREAIHVSTRQLARKQRKWFRRFPEIEWIDREPTTTVDEIVERIVRMWGENTDG